MNIHYYLLVEYLHELLAKTLIRNMRIQFI